VNIKELKAILTNLKNNDKLHIMLDGSDYGEIVGIVQHKGIYFVCNQLEANRQLGEEINGISKNDDTEDTGKD
jgi:ribosome assembly protein YihI (activator of Der GTPase)